MRVIVTVSTYYPYKDGVQAVTEYLAEGLKKLGHDIKIITTRRSGDAIEEIHNGIEIIRLPIYTRYAIYHGNRNKYQKYIISLCAKADVIINSCTQNALTDYLLPILDKIPCKKILHLHGIYDQHWSKSDFASCKSFIYKIWRNIRWGHLYRTADFSRYDAIFQLHEFDYGYQYFLKHYGIKSIVLENAADSRFSVDSPIREGKKYCVCVANFIPRKNQQFIIEAYLKSNICNNVDMVLVGSHKTPYAAKLEQKYSNNNIQFLYEQTREDIIELVRNASLYLLGSTWEAFSISLIESMAASVPFISTNVGVANYLPGGVTVTRQEEMTYWIDLFFSHEEVRQRYARAGHQYYCDRLTAKDKVDEVEKVIKAICVRS